MKMIIKCIDDLLVDALEQAAMREREKNGNFSCVAEQYEKLAKYIPQMKKERPKIYEQMIKGEVPVDVLVTHKDKFETKDQIKINRPVGRYITRTPLFYRGGQIVASKEDTFTTYTEFTYKNNKRVQSEDVFSGLKDLMYKNIRTEGKEVPVNEFAEVTK